MELEVGNRELTKEELNEFREMLSHLTDPTVDKIVSITKTFVTHLIGENVKVIDAVLKDDEEIIRLIDVGEIKEFDFKKEYFDTLFLYLNLEKKRLSHKRCGELIARTNPPEPKSEDDERKRRRDEKSKFDSYVSKICNLENEFGDTSKFLEVMVTAGNQIIEKQKSGKTRLVKVFVIKAMIMLKKLTPKVRLSFLSYVFQEEIGLSRYYIEETDKKEQLRAPVPKQTEEAPLEKKRKRKKTKKEQIDEQRESVRYEVGKLLGLQKPEEVIPLIDELKKETKEMVKMKDPGSEKGEEEKEPSEEDWLEFSECQFANKCSACGISANFCPEFITRKKRAEKGIEFLPDEEPLGKKDPVRCPIAVVRFNGTALNQYRGKDGEARFKEETSLDCLLMEWHGIIPKPAPRL